MKKFLLLLPLLTCGQFLTAQMILKDCTGIRSFRVTRGDTVLINCDSAFVLNPSTFAAYQLQSAKAVRLNATSRELAGAYAGLFNLQEARLSEQSKEFEQLSLKMDSLSRESAHSATRVIFDVDAVSRAVEKVTADLTEVQSMLEQTRSLLANQEKKKKKNGFGRYVIGFGIGFALGIIVNPLYAN
jgi:hypothetical protein